MFETPKRAARSFVRLPLALALLPSVVRSDVLVVDAAGGPGSDHTDLQAAVDAAADGDLVLVRSGAYGQLTIAGRSLTIAADAGATATVERSVSISGVPPGGRVVVSNLDVLVPNQMLAPSWSLSDNEGVVLLEDCSAAFSTPVVSFAQLDWNRIHDTDSAILHRFRASGAGAEPLVGDPMTGLQVLRSHVDAYDCDIRAPKAPSFEELDGETGLVLGEGASIFLEESFVRGGQGSAGGGTDPWGSCLDLPGDGGTGLLFEAGHGGAVVLDSIIVPGGGGSAPPHCGTGSAGTPVEGGQTTPIDEEGVRLTLTSPARHGELLDIFALASADDFVVLAYSASLAPPLEVPGLAGPLVPDVVDLGLEALGNPFPSGTLWTQVTVTFPLPLQSAEAFVQVVVLTDEGSLVAGDPHLLVYLGPGL